MYETSACGHVSFWLFFCGCRAFVIGLSQISSSFSWVILFILGESLFKKKYRNALFPIKARRRERGTRHLEKKGRLEADIQCYRYAPGTGLEVTCTTPCRCAACHALQNCARHGGSPKSVLPTPTWP